MSDIFIEQIVKKKKTQGDNAIIVGSYILVAIICLFTLLIFPGFVPIVLLIGFFGAYYVGSKRNLEFEYSFTNTELDIDAIYNKQKRKRLCSYDLKDCILIFSSKNENQRLRYDNLKTEDYSSGENLDATYIIVLPTEGETKKIIIEPNERLLVAFEQKLGRAFMKN